MIGDKIKKIRIEKGLTQTQLAELAQLPQPTIHYVESGKSPRMDTLDKITQALGITLEELFQK